MTHVVRHIGIILMVSENYQIIRRASAPMSSPLIKRWDFSAASVFFCSPAVDLILSLMGSAGDGGPCTGGSLVSTAALPKGCYDFYIQARAESMIGWSRVGRRVAPLRTVRRVLTIAL